MIIYVVTDYNGGSEMQTNVRGFFHKAAADAFASELTVKNAARQKYNEERVAFSVKWVTDHPYPADQSEHNAHYQVLNEACQVHMQQVMPELAAEREIEKFFMTDHAYEVEELEEVRVRRVVDERGEADRDGRRGERPEKRPGAGRNRPCPKRSRM